VSFRFKKDSATPARTDAYTIVFCSVWQVWFPSSLTLLEDSRLGAWVAAEVRKA
jgi:hypothetical protein